MLLRQWDRAPRAPRLRMLERFARAHDNATSPELEAALNGAPALLFTRLVMWLRLFRDDEGLGVLVRAIGVFVWSHAAYADLLHDLGGVAPLIAAASRTGDGQCEALRCLRGVCRAGRQWREALCNLGVAEAVVDALALCKEADVCTAAEELFVDLAPGNPERVQFALVDLALHRANAVAQYHGGRALVRVLNGPLTERHVEAAGAMLRSFSLGAQREGQALLRALLASSCADDAERLLGRLLSDPSAMHAQAAAARVVGDEVRGDRAQRLAKGVADLLDHPRSAECRRQAAAAMQALAEAGVKGVDNPQGEEQQREGSAQIRLEQGDTRE